MLTEKILSHLELVIYETPKYCVAEVVFRLLHSALHVDQHLVAAFLSIALGKRRIHLSDFLLFPTWACVLERKPKENLGELDFKSCGQVELLAPLACSSGQRQTDKENEKKSKNLYKNCKNHKTKSESVKIWK